MANKFNKFLGDVLRGFLDPKGNLGDYQHASRLYVDDTFRLAPKTKFLYYVVFNINPDALEDVSFQDRHALELNYLVKNVDLPKYTINTETLNQYNRKTNIYTKITYDPVSLSFHDDNNGITNMLWALYYGYYFNDRNNSADPYSDVSPIAYHRTTYSSKTRFPFRYGMDVTNNDSSGAMAPFFSSIQLFTLSRQRFFSYMLCNPKITKWDHDTMDQNEGGGIVENKMTLAYDAVIYNSGMIDVDDPAGFAVLHYDNSPSPIVNEEILQNGMSGIFGDLFSMNSFASPMSYMSGLRNGGINPYQSYGNQMPYGYGSPNFYGSTTYTPLVAGGLQNYGFGSSSTLLKTAAVVAGVGLVGNIAGNILKNVFSTTGQKVENNNTDKYGVATPDNPEGKTTGNTDTAAAASTGSLGAGRAAERGVSPGGDYISTTEGSPAGDATGGTGAQTGFDNVNTSSPTVYDQESGMSFPNPNYSPNSSMAAGRSAERDVPVSDAYGPPAPSFGRRSEAAYDANELRQSNASMVESAQFNGGDTGSRGDRLDSGSTSNFSDTYEDNNVGYNQMAEYDYYAEQQRETANDAASSDYGSGSISNYGEPEPADAYAYSPYGGGTDTPYE